MSFSFSFQCKREEAAAQVDEQYGPECVKTFVKQAVEHYPEGQQVSIYAYGHMFDGNSFNESTCNVTVKPLAAVVEPTPPEVAPVEAPAEAPVEG
jgi:hypothetical protein